jgi:quercetin 2,3-dioxygenase
MIILRRNNQRQYDRRRRQEGWRTFTPRSPADPLAGGFCTLELLNEDRLRPGARVEHSQRDGEVITYVREGALAYQDSLGHAGLIQAGEFHHMTVARGIGHSETNPSRTDAAHVFQIWLSPSELARAPGPEQKRFSAAERRGTLCVVASPNRRRGSLLVHQDVLMYSAMLDPGQHVVLELAPGRSAWLHLVRGQATVAEVSLITGDSAGITAERAVSLTAREPTEILLLDLGDPALRAWCQTADRVLAKRGAPAARREEGEYSPY